LHTATGSLNDHLPREEVGEGHLTDAFDVAPHSQLYGFEDGSLALSHIRHDGGQGI
jgi:hypothetical protein